MCAEGTEDMPDCNPTTDPNCEGTEDMPDCNPTTDPNCEAVRRKRKSNIHDILKEYNRRRKRELQEYNRRRKRQTEEYNRRRKRQTEAGQGIQWQYCSVPDEDKKLSCHPGISFEDVRLENSRLEILHSGQWGTISDQSWDIAEANVMCRMLGLGTATQAIVGAGNTGTTAANGPVLISDIDCNGEEVTLLDCVYTAAAPGSGDHTYDVGATCSEFGRKKRETEIHENVEIDVYAEFNERLKRQIMGGDYNLEFDFASDDELGMLVDGKAGTFQCGLTGATIPLWQTCNNYPDCEDGSDEIFCGPPERLCDLHFRPCRLSDTCIEPEFECDGTDDCLYGMDEAFCNIEECPSNYWKCPSRPFCIPLYNRCDTVNDCGDWRDEENCTNIESAETPNPFEDKDWYLPYTGFASEDFFRRFEDDYYQAKSFHRTKGEDPVDWKSFFTFSSTADYSDLLEVFKITRREISEYGHQVEDFILECTYDQLECQNNFTWFETDQYGNCYTFNFNPEFHYVSTQTGATNGLRMTLNLQQDEYISLGGREAGVRVTITPPDVRPRPDEDGITIRPGVVSSIALRFENISRLGGLYGDCASPDTKMEILERGEIVQSDNEAYDRQVCLRTCLHKNILKFCQCSDTIQLKGPRCHVSNTTQDVCKQVMRILHQSDLLKCGCPNQCSSKTYTKTTSTSKWPSNVYRDHLLRFIHAINPISTANINDRTSIDDNLVRLEVFFEQLNYATTKEVPAYSVESLFSDVGGTAGLYIGFSLITFLEFGVLVIELVKRFCLRGRARQELPFRIRRRHPFRRGQQPQQPPPGFFPQQFPEQYPMAFQQQYGMSMF
ncbi:uncharacterized protein [Amphiura filiformis]|uniref:uncharacterized protein n=1 Tax=Amphiura filiformis TaxID=82378 RepID=UPI003B21B437